MSRNTSEIERAVARTLRDSLEKLQHTTDEVNQAVGDLVSACSSAKPSNTLPHMLRAQTAAASLAATLDVLSRFITGAMQPGWNAPYPQSEVSFEPEEERMLSRRSEAGHSETFAAATMSEPEALETPADIEPAPAVVDEALRSVASETEAALETEGLGQTEDVPVAPPVEEPVAVQATQVPVERAPFDLVSLPSDLQELHRRANRVAKVSMQDIKMLRPGDVRAGKENHDLCLRLRDDIERAHREYERRFHAIFDHPVDYFYAWMVEILGEGDPRALGEYPYPSPAVRR